MSRFYRPTRAEIQFHSALRKLAKVIGRAINATPGLGHPPADESISRRMFDFADSIGGWARATAQRMIVEVNRTQLKSYADNSREISKALQHELENAPTGQAVHDLMAEQVALIKSMPIEAAQRVHKLTLEGLLDSTRAEDMVAEIMRTGNVTESRAKLIARTEVGRTAAILDQARAQAVGSPGYMWLTAEDSDVRPSHREMDGKFVPWSQPPTLDGLTGHAGALPNCRCTRIVVFK